MQQRMTSRSFACLALAFLLAGCTTEADKKKKQEAEKKKTEKATAQKKNENLQKQIDDPAFTGFLGRLRAAVAGKDLPAISAMMTADFGYRWDTAPVGDNVFTYWDLNDSWPVLSKLLRERFVANDGYMVAPASVATDPNYHGFRAGMRMVNGSWKFAYFVPREEAADR